REAPFEVQLKKLQNTYSRDVQVTDKAGKTTTQKVHGLTFAESSKLRNEYDIELDEGLKPLRDAFDKHRFDVNTIEGRQGKPEFLKETDFHKLFFGTEYLGVGSQDAYTPKVWPPYVKAPKERQSPLLPEKALEQRLFDTAAKPLIFWESVRRPGEIYKWNPGDNTIDFVEQQYRMDKARTKLMAKVKEVAEE